MTDADVRRVLYDAVLQRGAILTIADVARELGVEREDAVESFHRLANGRILVLQRTSDEILMLPPFSSVPTSFVVESEGKSFFANCIWDSLGIPAMLHADARILTSCADCGSAAELQVRDGQVIGEGLVHFAVPARKWWENIVFT